MRVGIDVRLDVVEPELLAGAFEAGRAGVVEVRFEELFARAVDDLFVCHGAKLAVK